MWPAVGHPLFMYLNLKCKHSDCINLKACMGFGLVGEGRGKEGGRVEEEDSGRVFI